jgi:uncharacterized protein (TIGR02996 family)
MEEFLRAACIRAIVENPFDQAPKLIYLDALDESESESDRAEGERRRAAGPPNFGYGNYIIFNSMLDHEIDSHVLAAIVGFVRERPIISITFAYKQPEATSGVFYWHSRGETQASTIPIEFFDGIPSETQRFWRARNGHCGIHFLTKDEAYRWLSERAIDYGRRKAGLTPIDWEKARETLNLQKSQLAS